MQSQSRKIWYGCHFVDFFIIYESIKSIDFYVIHEPLERSGNYFFPKKIWKAWFLRFLFGNPLLNHGRQALVSQERAGHRMGLLGTRDQGPAPGTSGDTFFHPQPGCTISWPLSFDDAVKWDESRSLRVLSPSGSGYARCGTVQIMTYVLPLASAITQSPLTKWGERTAWGDTHTAALCMGTRISGGLLSVC